uniref:Uncharacterized protein n=1 Tax=Sphaerodactylus townsendi TaxID=933632 RepID=A0ACB8FVR6_9SAUR
MAAQGGKGSVRKLKQIIVKTSLNSPYALQWSPLDRTDMHFILEALEDVIKQLGLKKIEFRKKKKPSTSKKEDKEQLQGGSSKPPEQNETEDTRAHGWTDLNIRGQLAIGINEVTRALEKNELLLVLVCKSAKPTMITSHLIPLSASRGVPACQVPRLSERLAPVLGLTSVLALGFKQSADAFAEVAKAIIPRIPSLDVPWIQHGNEQPPHINQFKYLQEKVFKIWTFRCMMFTDLMLEKDFLNRLKCPPKIRATTSKNLNLVS